MRIYSFLKKKRSALKYTQMQLAIKAGVSLPTIQNLEMGKGNPTLSLLRKVCAPLKISLEFTTEEPDWNLLQQAGLCLTLEEKTSKKRKKITPEILALELKKAPHSPLALKNERTKEAFMAMMGAIQHYYPTFYIYCLDSPFLKSLCPKYPWTGRMTKLVRITYAKLSEIL